MSWLTGLAGKAEELLNKVDQQAATALHNEDSAAPAPNTGNHQSWGSHKDSSSGASGHSSYLSPAPTQQAAMSSMTASKSVPSNLNRFDNGFNSRSRKSISSSPVPQNGSPAKKKDKDDELFEFLNSSTTVENKKPALAVKTGITNGTHSRHSSTSSSASTKSGKTTESGLTNSSLADKQGKLLLAYLYIWITSWGHSSNFNFVPGHQQQCNWQARLHLTAIQQDRDYVPFWCLPYITFSRTYHSLLDIFTNFGVALHRKKKGFRPEGFDESLFQIQNVFFFEHYKLSLLKLCFKPIKIGLPLCQNTPLI